MDIPSKSRFVDALLEFRDLMKEQITTGIMTCGKWVCERNGNLVIAGEPDTSQEFIVIGDIHGDYQTLEEIVGREEVSFTITLGDYVDRGTPEGQVMTLYWLFTARSEGRLLIPLRGNHEPPPGLEPAGQDYALALYRVFGEDASEIVSLLKDMFQLLPHAFVLKGYALMLHGGPPTVGLEKPVHEYLAGGPNPDYQALEEILWNDPIESDTIRAPNPRGAGSLWGRPVTEKALSKIGGRVIVRGHQPAHWGYKWNHNRRVLTLFSRKGAPYFNEHAAYLRCTGVLELVNEPAGCIRIL